MCLAKVKTAICLDQALLAEVDRLAQERHLSRSAFVAQAVEARVRRLRHSELLQQYNEAYADGLDDVEHALLEHMVPIMREQLKGE